VPSGVWLYGRHAIQAALENPERRCRRLLLGTAASRSDDTAATAWPLPVGLVPERTSRDTIEALLPPDAVHQGAALLVDPLPWPDLTEICSPATGGPVVVLDQVTDPRNVGAVLRSAAAFGARAVLLQQRHAPDESGALAKAASGALERVPVLRETNLARALDTLKEIGYWCVGLDASAGQTLAALDLDRPAALVLGAEGAGLRRLTAERCDHLARLPIDEGTDSLNVSAAAAVALYEFARS
jgi:23S rRNA (guanosine2251-2'-O)-methyltransferase